MRGKSAVITLVSAFSGFAVAQGVPPEPGEEIQRRQQQQLDAARALNPPAEVFTPTAAAPEVDLTRLPAESPCFPIRRIALSENAFDWLAEWLQPVIGQCIGQQGLRQIQTAANNALIARGYITSRVLVPEQSLESGELELQVVPGRVSAIRAALPAIGWTPMALPVGVGGSLNQRDIDQGLENLRRLQSEADARFDIAPGAKPGESELVLHPGTGKRWHLVFGVDNAGLNTTGKTGLSASFTYDSPLHLYDQLQISGSTNANFGAPGEGNQSVAGNYSVPLGYAMWTLGANRSRYKTSVPGFDGPILYGGVQSQLRTALSAVVFRNANARTEVRAGLAHKINRNTYDGVDLPVQTRDVIEYELGLSHRHYLGDIEVSGGLVWRASVPGLSKTRGMVLDAPGFDGRTALALSNLAVLAPFRLGHHSFSYQFGWNTQNAQTPLTPADYFTIGTRYAVRGFDQQTTLAAESGWAISNELDWYVPTRIGMQAVYGALDTGRVRGPASDFLTGRTLVGAALGLRGQLAPKNRLGAALSYDVSAGWPLSKPPGLSSSPTLLFQINTTF